MNHEVTLLFNQGHAGHPKDIQIAPRLDLRRARSQTIRDLLFYAFAIKYCANRQRRFDVLHIHGDWAAFILGALLARIVHAKVLVASIHGETRNGIWQIVYRAALSRYDVVYCTGLRETARIRALGISGAHWQPSGVSNEFLQFQGTPRARGQDIDVICVASLVHVKNIELLLLVANQLRTTTFEVVGDGPLRVGLQEMAVKLGLANVKFSGRLCRRQLAARLAAAKIFYLPSTSEGTPTSMMEAMVLGLPVVVTPSNDYGEIVRQGLNGYVTEDFSIIGSIKPISLLLSDCELRQLIAARNRLDAQSFTWPTVARKITAWMQK